MFYVNPPSRETFIARTSSQHTSFASIHLEVRISLFQFILRLLNLNNFMGRTKFSVKKILEIMKYFHQFQSIIHTAQHFSIGDTTSQPSQILKFLREKTKSELKAKSNAKALSLHEGHSFENQSLEMDIYDWTVAQRQNKISVLYLQQELSIRLFLLTIIWKRTNTLPCHYGFIDCCPGGFCHVAWQLMLARIWMATSSKWSKNLWLF